MVKQRLRRVLAGVLLVGAMGAGAQSKSAEKPKAETRLNAGEQKAVLAELDEILKFASDDTKLPIRKQVKGVYLTREQVNGELRKRFDEDEGAKRMQRSELVLKKFGLLDREFQLKPFLLSLLTEQIAGFYDSKTHVMNLLDWVAADEQRPVMAHELTHALQDQKVGLEKWGDQEVKGVAKNVGEDNHHVQMDEVDTAREAVLEGQAMVAFADYELKPYGKTLRDVPEMTEKLKQGAGDMGNSPVMARAPLLLQQALVFPYVEGLGFEAAILQKQGTAQAFEGTLARPPVSSFEVLHPELYMAHAPVPVMVVPDVHPLLEAAGYMPYDIGVMGELDVRITTELFGGRPLADAVSPAWRGGMYYAAQKKMGADKESTASLGLMYSSRWKNEDSARSFFTVYEGNLGRKYRGLKRRQADEKDATERVYSTNEGDVLLTLDGVKVYVGEGFEVGLSRKLRDAVDAAQGVGPVREAALGPLANSELLRGLSGWMGSFGMMKFAVR